MNRSNINDRNFQDLRKVREREQFHGSGVGINSRFPYNFKTGHTVHETFPVLAFFMLMLNAGQQRGTPPNKNLILFTQLSSETLSTERLEV
jgi:hypothetical protein